MITQKPAGVPNKWFTKILLIMSKSSDYVLFNCIRCFPFVYQLFQHLFTHDEVT